MADADSEKKTSPYDYPRRPASDIIPPEYDVVVGETSDTTIEIKDSNDEKKEKELPEKNHEKDDPEGIKDTETPLLEKRETKLEIKPDEDGEDTPTLPLPDKKKKSLESLDIERKQEKKLPKYLFPLTRIKNAWNDSDNVFQFVGRATCIIFQTVGWFTCAGGVPFVSLVNLIIGCMYLDQCNIQPNIPVYLVVSGVIGSLQHFIEIWTKYVTKDSKGRLKVYRSYCRSINGLFHLFLMIWFILGCVWVYGAFSEVVFNNPARDEYCHKALYYYTFWIFNLSFILLGLIVFLSICFLICIIATDQN